MGPLAGAAAAPAGDDGPVQPAQLAAFLRDHLLAEPQLARQHPPSSKAYWVCGWLGRAGARESDLSLLRKREAAPALEAR
jgi:hypothetical protein